MVSFTGILRICQFKWDILPREVDTTEGFDILIYILDRNSSLLLVEIGIAEESEPNFDSSYTDLEVLPYSSQRQYTI